MEDQEYKKTKPNLQTLDVYCNCMFDLIKLKAKLEKTGTGLKSQIQNQSIGFPNFSNELEETKEAAEKHLQAIRLEQYKANGNKQGHYLINMVENKDNIEKHNTGLYERPDNL